MPTTIERLTGRRICAVVSFVLALLGATGIAHAVPSISVAPGTSPAGYLPLALFGVIPNAGVTNDGVENLSVPAFAYAGETWTSVGFASNGFVIVGGGSNGTAVNQNLPDPAGPNNVLAPYWTDLDPTAGGGLRAATLTDGVNTWIVLEWSGVPEATDGAVTNVQVWIGVNGVEDITFTYDPTHPAGDGNGGLLTIGAEDKTGTVGGLFYFNGIGTLPDEDLRVTTTDLPVAQAPEPPSLLLLGIALLGLAGWRLGAPGARRRITLR
jgi:hypothetical protein